MFYDSNTKLKRDLLNQKNDTLNNPEDIAKRYLLLEKLLPFHLIYIEKI